MSALGREGGAARVRIPADVEREDRLLANLTARQLAILGVGGIALWTAYEATRHLVPLGVFAAVAAPLAAVALTLALGHIGGVPADRLALAAWRQHRAPRRLVPAPEGVPDVPAFLGVSAAPVPAPLHLPLVGISGDGPIDLGEDGVALICRASAVSFSLRTPAEQEALVVAFGRYLNSLGEPAELLIRAEPIDLAPSIAELDRAAPALPHTPDSNRLPVSTRVLAELATTRDLLRREVLLVLRDVGGEGSGDRLRRRGEEATAALAAAGVTLVVLGGDEAHRCVARALDPGGPPSPRAPRAGDEVVTGRYRLDVEQGGGSPR